MNKRFYIKELRVIGDNVTPAKIVFKKGFNLVTGGSNAGKSYIASCIDFMFGGKGPLKDISQSKPYHTIFLEIETDSGEIYTLKRSIKGGHFYYVPTNIDKFYTGNPVELHEIHSSKSPDNISSFLLQLCQLNHKKIKKDKYNKTNDLSFREVVKFVLINEGRIITEESPVFPSGQVINQTKEKSLFHFLLSSFDASDLEETEKPKDRKLKISTKINFLDSLITELSNKINKIDYDEISLKKDEFSRQILKYKELINETSNQIEKLTTEKSSFWNELENQKSELLHKEELIKRFYLLKEHYKSDLKRLEFIQEGEHFYSQLQAVHCPVCGNEMTEEHSHLDVEQTENLNKAISVELEKIMSKMVDLEDTTNELESDKKLLLNHIKSLQNRLNDIELELKTRLEPVINVANDEIEKLLFNFNQIAQYDSFKHQLSEYVDKKNSLLSQLKNVKEPLFDEKSLENTVLKQFCKSIENLLIEWKYDKSIVNFDISNYDITLSTVARKTDGKGKRAITYSAFIIGLMQYCMENDLPHPGFVILDSPLTTYKKGEVVKDSELLPKDIEKSFFNNLSQINKDQQIIVFDNKDVEAEIKSKINYKYYSGEEGNPPDGFFPNR